MMLRSLKIFALCCFAHATIAQKYLPATISLKDGTLFHGKMRNQNSPDTPQEITFIVEGEEFSVTYDAIEADSFSIRRSNRRFEYYEKHAVVLVDQNDAGQRNAPRPAFLKLLLRDAALNLYEYRVGKTVQLFVGKDTLHALTYKAFKKRSNEALNENSSDYLQELYIIVADCPKLTKSLNTLDYTSKAVQRLLTRYFKCQKQTADYAFKKPSNTKLFVNAGIGRVQLDYGDDRPFSISTLGVGMQYTFPTIKKYLSIYAEMTNRRTTTRIIGSYTGRDQSQSFISEVKENWLHLNLSPRVYIFKGFFTNLYCQFGGYIANGLTSNYDYQSVNTINNRVTTNNFSKRTKYDLFEEPNMDIGLMGGVGLQWRRIQLDLRWESPNNISQHRQKASFHATLGFRLTR